MGKIGFQKTIALIQNNDMLLYQKKNDGMLYKNTPHANASTMFIVQEIRSAPHPRANSGGFPLRCQFFKPISHTL